jgi:hypothetical protein
MNQNEVLCNIKYEQLKFDARKSEFGFPKQYTLIISDDMKTIMVDNKVVGFLQYDNKSKNGNRILIFFQTKQSTY